jgi:glycosyltransferase involved in cell wall biosynthesis
MSSHEPRLLHVINSLSFETGGPVTGLHALVHGLQRLGVLPEVVCLDAPGTPGTKALPVEVHALGRVRTKYGYSPKLWHWLKQNAERFDAVIVNGIWQYHSLAVRNALKHSGRPYYVFTHGMLDPWFKRTFPLKHIKKWLYWPWAEYRVLRDAQGVLFTSEEERRLARQSFWLYRCREVVLGYGITPPPPPEPGNLFLQEHPHLENKRLWLFLGRVHMKKGCDQLIRSFALVADQHPDLHLVMAGPDPTHWRPALEKLSRSCGIANRISWPGMLTGRLKWDAFRAAEVFWLPSHQENFGLAIAEAMACGVPALISNKVNIWREVEEEEAGLVESDTFEGTHRLAQRWLALAPSIRQAMRANAQRCFQRRLSAHQAAERLADLLGLKTTAASDMHWIPCGGQLMHS